MEEGRKMGIEEGLKQGIEQGKTEGREQGVKEESNRIIINMLQKGMKVEQIEDLIGVSKEEIQRVKEQLDK